MNRRRFLFSATGSVLLIPKSVRILAMNDPCISHVRHETLHTIGDPAPGGGLSGQISGVPVCQMEFEEDDKVLFHFRVTNSSPAQVRFYHCQPWAGDSFARKELIGPFGQVNLRDFYKAGTQANGGWRADNDSNAFYAEVRNGSSWQRITALPNIQLAADARTATLVWRQQSQTIRFDVIAVDRR